MIVPMGINEKLKKELWRGKYHCHGCGAVQNHHLFRIKRYGTVFFIPIMAFTVKRGVVCDQCGAAQYLDKNDYKTAYAEQMAKFKERSFPVDVVMQDFNAKSVKLPVKWILVVLFALLSVFMTTSFVAMYIDIGEFELVSLPIVLLTLSVFYLPTYFLIRSLVFARQKKAYYEAVAEDRAPIASGSAQPQAAIHAAYAQNQPQQPTGAIQSPAGVQAANQSYIAQMKKSVCGAWFQYDFLLAARPYSWYEAVDWASYMESADLSGIGTISVASAAGAPEQELIEEYRKAGGSIRNMGLAQRECGVLGVGGNSRLLGGPLKIVWFNQTNTLRVFSIHDDEALLRRYVETAVRRTFGA